MSGQGSGELVTHRKTETDGELVEDDVASEEELEELVELDESTLF